MTTQFEEQQKFTQWWLWVIMVLLAALPLYGIYQQIILDQVFGDNPMSDFGLITYAVITFGLITLFWSIRLKTQITKTEIHIKMWPFANKTFKWSEVKSAKVIDYGFVGGWGVRLWTKYGTVYNTSGRKGLAIELKNGKKYLVGTQQETALNDVVKNMQTA